MAVIDVLVPMLGRPDDAERLASNLIETLSDQHTARITFIASESDLEVIHRLHHMPEDFIVLPGEPEPGDYARKINVGYEATSGEWLLLGASDIKLHECWDVCGIEVGEEYGAGVVGTNDLGNPAVLQGQHSTHPLVRRSYIDEQGGGWDGPGTVYHEGYFHQYVDTELVTVAQARGMWVFAHGSNVEHLHPFWKKSKIDPTYERGLEHGHDDGKLFLARSRGQR